MFNYIKLYLKGIAMGAADVVPGVSGGTIALISGIYPKLLESIRRINPTIIAHLKNNGFKWCCVHINLKFLIILFSGIITSIFTLAKLVSWMLVTYPILLWSFFLGLIIASIIHMLKQLETIDYYMLGSIILGIILALTITIAHPIALAPTKLNIFISGSIAICAMILPGISGSFILLLLGMYTPIIIAVKQLDLVTIGLFATGCLTGLLIFSHLLSWLLKNYKSITFSFLIGLMIGTIGKVWPWKIVSQYHISSTKMKLPLIEENVLPWDYTRLTNQPNMLFYAIGFIFIGFSCVCFLEKISIIEKK